MTPEEYKQKVRAIDQFMELLKGNTPPKDIAKWRQEWIQRLDDESKTSKEVLHKGNSGPTSKDRMVNWWL